MKWALPIGAQRNRWAVSASRQRLYNTDLDPHYEGLIDDLEKVQKRATRNYTYEKGSTTDILKKLKWETLQKRRKDNRIILLYKGLKGRAKISKDDLIPKNRRCRNQHSLASQIPSTSTNAYLHSFSPRLFEIGMNSLIL